MARKSKAVRPEEKTQSERFIETARAVGVDETGTAFEQAVDKLLSKKTSDSSTAHPPRRRFKRADRS